MFRAHLRALNLRSETSCQHIRNSLRPFSTTRFGRQQEHKTYFQQDSQQGSAFNAGNHAGDGREEATRSGFSRPWFKYWMTFCAGLYMYPWIFAFMNECRDRKELHEKLYARVLQARHQPEGQIAVPDSGSANAVTRLDMDGKETVFDSPADLIKQLEQTFTIERLLRSQEGNAAAEEIRQTQSLLDSANESQLKVHKALFAHMTSGKNDSVVLDDALLESHPIVLSDQTRVPTNKAALMRVVDKAGKNRVLILGVDLDFHKDFQSVAARFPGDCYDLDEWLCNVADELARAGNNAEDGVAIYLYSNRAIVDVNHETGFRWMTRYKQSDFPLGFPLRQMRMIEQV